jgi:trigger factor
VEIVIPDAYRRALDRHELAPIEQPELTVIEPLEQGKPFVFKATLQVEPEVALGKYKGLKIEKPKAGVEEEQVRQRMDALREEYAELVLTDRVELRHGDFAVVDFDGYIDDKPYKGGAAKGYALEIGGGDCLPEFSEGLTGARVGEIKKILVHYPDDSPMKELAGREVEFRATPREIKVKELPELNDEFAKSLGHETFEALRDEVRSSLQKTAEREAERVFTQRVVDQVVAGAKAEIPKLMIDRQIEDLFDILARNIAYRGQTIDDYLADLGKTEDEAKNDMRPEAETMVRRNLVLAAVRKAEKIEPDEAEIEQRVVDLASMARVKDAAEFRRRLEKSERLGIIKDDLAREKTIKFLAETAEATPERKSKR